MRRSSLHSHWYIDLFLMLSISVSVNQEYEFDLLLATRMETRSHTVDTNIRYIQYLNLCIRALSLAVTLIIQQLH